MQYGVILNNGRECGVRMQLRPARQLALKAFNKGDQWGINGGSRGGSPNPLRTPCPPGPTCAKPVQQSDPFSCLVTASGPPSVNTSTQGQHLRPLLPRTRGLPLCSKPLIQDHSDNARGLPQGSRPNTAPGPHAHSRPTPTNRWDLPRFKRTRMPS